MSMQHDKLLKMVSLVRLALVGLVMLFLFALILLPGSKDTKKVQIHKRRAKWHTCFHPTIGSRP